MKFEYMHPNTYTGNIRYTERYAHDFLTSTELIVSHCNPITTHGPRILPSAETLLARIPCVRCATATTMTRATPITTALRIV